MRNLVAGTAAGVLATAAMSTVMLAGEKAGLMGGQPPKHIVRAVLPGHKHHPKRGEKPLAVVAHLGFGGAAGALFGVLTRGRPARLPWGVGYALAVWLASYEGLVPSMGIMPRASEDSQPGRPVVMATGHVVYGTALVMALNRLLRSAQPAASPRAARPRPRPVARHGW